MPVPQIDFSPLGDLGKVYDESKRRAQREAILSSIPPDASTQTLGTLGLQLMRAGVAEGGIPLMRLGDAAARDARDFDWRRQEAGRAQGNTERILALKERLAAVPRGMFYGGVDNGEGVGASANPQDVIAEAKDAIARGAPRGSVALRLQRLGINPSVLTGNANPGFALPTQRE
jgi:hypothetical protein